MKRLIFAFLSGFLWSNVAVAADRASAEQLTAFFEDVAFGSEYGKQGSKVVQKWQEPIRISVSAMSGGLIEKPDGKRELKLAKAKPEANNIKLIRKHLGALVKLTGVKTESPKKVGKKPNFFIKFVPRLAMHAPFLVKGVSPKLLQRLAKPRVCYFLSAAKKGRIVWATIVVNNELPPKAMDACLLEELTQALGLPNDSDLVKPSLFNNRAQPTQLSGNDKALLQALYDVRLKPGMTKEGAMPIAAKIIEELALK